MKCRACGALQYPPQRLCYKCRTLDQGEPVRFADRKSTEDLGFCAPGTGAQEVDRGTFSLHGDLPVNTDGGLKSFGHPIGASGLRMLYECYNQLTWRAGERQVPNPKLALAQNLGENPGSFTCSVIIVGSPN